MTSPPLNEGTSLQRSDGKGGSGGVAGTGEGSTSQSELTVPSGLVECQAQLQEAVTKLQRFLESHQLAQAAVSGAWGFV